MRNVFALHSSSTLYGSLQETLEYTVNKLSKLYDFDKIYFISDSKSNWRKEIYSDYKGTRVKNAEINWEFVGACYEEFKDHLPANVQLLEKNRVEGDDWFAYLVDHYNAKNVSTLMVTNDEDIRQTLHYTKDYINVIINENSLHNKLFLPLGYKTWIYNFNKDQPLRMSLDPNRELYGPNKMLRFIKSLEDGRKVEEVDMNRVIFNKLIGGDKGDNVKAAWDRIGIKTVDKIYNRYIEVFNKEPEVDDSLIGEVGDIIVEVKKLKDSDYDKVLENLKLNNILVNFSKIPLDIRKLMSDSHNYE